jgi:HSP20 family protein
MGRIINPLGAPVSWLRTGETRQSVDVYETADAVIIRLAIPGGDSGALTLTIGEASLRVRGETPPPAVASDQGVIVHSQQIPYGPFDRSVPLPCPIDSKASRARFVHGILEITLPKRSAKTRTIPITVTRA